MHYLAAPWGAEPKCFQLEEFHTSGGMAHSIPDMLARNVQECDYKTYRWKGHHHIVTNIYKTLGEEGLRTLFEKTECDNTRDMVLINATIKTAKALTLSKKVRINASDKFSAMQLATAVPIMAMAHIMAEGLMDDLKTVKYSDVPFGRFNDYIFEELWEQISF